MPSLPYVVALGATLVVEVPVWALLLPRTHGITTGRAATIGVAVNLLSHPILWFLLHPAAADRLDPWAALALSEAVVVLAETAVAAALLGPRTRGGAPVARRPILLGGVALAANLLSIALGLLVQGG